MKNNIKRICNYCKNEYLNIYKTKGKYEYTTQTQFCSKSCAVQCTRNKGEFLTKEKLEAEVLEYIKLKGQYCPLTMICKDLKRSSKTFCKFKISIKDLNESLGFKNTVQNSKFSNDILNILVQYYSNIISEYTNEKLISEKGCLLRIDFYIPSENLAIEADGDQHTNTAHTWYSEYNKKI